MTKEELKFVRGSLKQGEPAEILFFDDVEWWSCDRFLEELQYIIDCINPSEINILINSAGGNVVEGMKVFTKILNCPIPTRTTIAGIAASMGSVIWAAGQKLYMSDFSLLMIHNPWMGADMDDPNNRQIIEAFKKQITTVYCKRFGFSEDKVKEIMDGQPGCDGTFLTAQDAVDQGFIPANHVIETPQTIKDKVAAAVKGNTNSASVQAIMSLVLGQNYQQQPQSAISDKEPKGNDNINSQINQKKMEELKVVASQLGIQGEVSLEKVSDAILQLKQGKADLKKASDELATVKSELNDLKIKHEAEKATSASLQKSLDEVKSELQTYKDKEKAERTAAINAMIDEAIAAGKISAEAKASWVAMAEQNFDMVKSSLESIPARQQLSKQIAGAPENRQAAQDGALTEEQKIQAHVESLLPEGFAFKKVSDLK